MLRRSYLMYSKVILIYTFYQLIINIHTDFVDGTTNYYDPVLTLQKNYTKSANFSQSKIKKFQSNGYYMVQMYDQNLLVINSPYEQMQFTYRENYTNFTNKSLIDFSMQQSLYTEVHLLFSDDSIQIFNPRKNYTQLISIQSLGQNPILTSTNQSFYVVSTDNSSNGTAIINRISRLQNIKNDTLRALNQFYNTNFSLAQVIATIDNIPSVFPDIWKQNILQLSCTIVNITNNLTNNLTDNSTENATLYSTGALNNVRYLTANNTINNTINESLNSTFNDLNLNFSDTLLSCLDENQKFNCTPLNTSHYNCISTSNISLFCKKNQSFLFCPNTQDNKLIAIAQSMKIINDKLIIQQNNFTLQITGDKMRATSCKKSYNQSEYIVVWNINSDIQVVRCSLENCTSIKFINNSLLTNGQFVSDKINFESDCSLLLVEYDKYHPLQILPILSNSSITYQIDSKIYQFHPTGGSFKEGAFLEPGNNSFIIFSIEKSRYYRYYDGFGTINQYSRYYNYKRSIYLNYEERIEIWSFICTRNMTYYSYYRGFCTDCSQFCTSCDESNGCCKSCISGYHLSGCSCVINYVPPVDPVPVVTPVHNISSNTSTKTHIQQIPQNKPIQPIIPQQKKQTLGAIYPYEQAISDSVIDGFHFIGDIIGTVFVFLQIFPLMWLFMKFMNFFNLCSFYILLGANIPEYFQIILKIIWDSANSPVFNLDDIINHIQPLTQKLEKSNDDFGISSNFWTMNLENIIFFSFTLAQLFVCMILKESLSKNSWIAQKIDNFFDAKQILINQFVSYGPSILLPLNLIIYSTYCTSYNDRINLTLYICLMISVVIFPFMIVPVDQQETNINDAKNSTSKSTDCISNNNHSIKSLKTKQKPQLIKKLQWFYQSNCNTLIPILAIIGVPSLFYAGVLFYFGFGLWLASKSEEFKINAIILASYKLIFHILFIVIVCCQNNFPSVQHNLALVCVLILLVASVHEISWFFFIILYFIYKEIKSRCQLSKVENFNDQVTELSKKTSEETNLYSQTQNNSQRFIKKLKAPKHSLNYSHYLAIRRLFNQQPDIQQNSYQISETYPQNSIQIFSPNRNKKYRFHANLSKKPIDSIKQQSQSPKVQTNFSFRKSKFYSQDPSTPSKFRKLHRKGIVFKKIHNIP